MNIQPWWCAQCTFQAVIAIDELPGFAALLEQALVTDSQGAITVAHASDAAGMSVVNDALGLSQSCNVTFDNTYISYHVIMLWGRCQQQTFSIATIMLMQRLGAASLRLTVGQCRIFIVKEMVDSQKTPLKLLPPATLSAIYAYSTSPDASAHSWVCHVHEFAMLFLQSIQQVHASPCTSPARASAVNTLYLNSCIKYYRLCLCCVVDNQAQLTRICLWKLTDQWQTIKYNSKNRPLKIHRIVYRCTVCMRSNGPPSGTTLIKIIRKICLASTASNHTSTKQNMQSLNPCLYIMLS